MTVRILEEHTNGDPVGAVIITEGPFNLTALYEITDIKPHSLFPEVNLMRLEETEGSDVHVMPYSDVALKDFQYSLYHNASKNP